MNFPCYINSALQSRGIIFALFVAVTGCSGLPVSKAPKSDKTTASTLPTDSQDIATEEITAISIADNPDAVVVIPSTPASSDPTAQSTSKVLTTAIEIDALSGQIESSTDTAPPVDLWDKLRREFTLTYSNPNDPVIEKFETWYRKHPKYFDRLADRAYWYLPYILSQTEARGVPAEIALLPAIESAFRPEAVSRSNAVGMWQFIGATGKRFGLRRDWWMDGRRDMVQSTRAALDYLEILAEEFNHDWELVFAAYNAGEGTIRREVKSKKSQGKPTNYPNLSLRKETREYVPKLFAVRNIIANPEKYHITLRSIPIEQTLSVVDAKTQTDLAVAASTIPIDKETLFQFNRGYSRGVTPPNGPHKIVVPSVYEKQLAEELQKLSLQQRLRWARHSVRKGEYLGRIARQHGVTVDSIIQANQLSANLIKPGQELKIPISSGFHQYAQVSASDIKIEQGDKVYTVRKGDSLWKISQGNGIALAAILRWNGISKHTTLYPGQQLIVRKVFLN